MKAKFDNNIELSTDLDKKVYKDVVSPSFKETGDLVALAPRSLRALLLPLENWITKREYNRKATQKILEDKLKNVPEDLLDEPELYVGVPALEGLSYTIDNETLREMYANLLASSMRKDKKADVHPAYAQIIKEISPDEARVLKDISVSSGVWHPLVWVREYKSRISSKVLAQRYTNAFEYIRDPKRIASLIDNLERLKLVEVKENSAVSDESSYEYIENSDYIKRLLSKNLEEGHFLKVEKGSMRLTNFALGFINICIKE